MSVLQDHDDAGGEAHHQRGGQDVPGTGHQFVDNPVGGEAADDAAHDAHQQEEARDFRQIPVPNRNAHDQHDDRQQQHDENPLLAAAQADGFHALGGGHGSPAGLAGIKHHEQAEQQGQNTPADEAVFHAGEQRKFRHPLRNPYREGIEEGAGKADVGGHIHDQQTHDGIVAHRNDQRHDDAHEGNGLLAHAEDGAGQ